MQQAPNDRHISCVVPGTGRADDLLEGTGNMLGGE